MIDVTALSRNRDFQLLMTGRTLALVGGSMTSLALSLLAMDLTGSAGAASGVMAANFVANVVTSLPAGALVDRWDRKKVMVWSSLLLSACLGSLPLAAALGRLGFWHVVAISAAVGSLGMFYGPAETAAIRRVVPAEQLGQAMSANSARWGISSIVGGPLAGVLYAAGRTVPVIGDAAANLVAAACAMAVRADLRPGPRQPTHLRSDIREGLVWLTHHQGARLVAALTALTMFGVFTTITAVTLGLRQEGEPSSVVGLVQLTSGSALFLGSLAAGWCGRRWRIGPLLCTTSAIGLVTTFGLLLVHGAAPTLALYGLCARVGPPGSVGIQTWFVTITPDAVQGRAQTAMNVLTTSTIPVATIVTGTLLDHGGRTIALLPGIGALAVALLLALASAQLRSLPHLDELPALRADDADLADTGGTQ